MFIISNLIVATGMALKAVLSVYFWVVIAATLVSWFKVAPYHPLVRFLRTVTEPVFCRVRKWLPFVHFQGIDLSPLVVLVGVQFIEIAFVQTLLDFGRSLR